MITAAQFVTVNVADQQRALDFYTSKLGFEVLMNDPMDPQDPDGVRWIMLRPGPGAHTQVVLFQHPDGVDPRTLAGVVWECDDVPATVADLEAKGVEIDQPARQEFWGWWAQIRDSEGNLFGLGQGTSDQA